MRTPPYVMGMTHFVDDVAAGRDRTGVYHIPGSSDLLRAVISNSIRVEEGKTAELLAAIKTKARSAVGRDKKQDPAIYVGLHKGSYVDGGTKRRKKLEDIR